ncbi:transcription antitermination factor NusB [Flavobacterium alvei]|uniref:Transcription antitermination factor NusB n=1 Tax=Flavobacterium alvei TaxID=2080416 RepID=A0A2S5AFA9_9FLAO|nr:transcription antitermination factor NusB [Flavobacterium alvei]POY40897.1 transcription antitermination factor NusB [Flavobacterium alvei]HQE33379.1 transcription antitermination factor NusB [Flavobacterium alvei]HQF48860.1 transcription antitermination factor NusB [Flavobacterium alvei]HQK39037.1 transcription antitermination factor NusB [Flavobacterium alvei]
MQSIYAMHQNGSDNLEKEEKFLFYSIDAIQDLYLIMLSSLIEICKKESVFLHKSSQKHLATPQERKPNEKFIKNAIFQILAENNSLSIALETRKIDNWALNDDYILILLDAVKKSKLYANYMSNAVNTFEEDKEFIVNLFEQVIVPNEKLYDYLEDNKLTWIDDIPVVNTEIIKQLRAIKAVEGGNFRVVKLFKDNEDKDFVRDLFRKTILNEKELAKEYVDKTPNWDSERIAEIDTIILKMAICELLKFPSIPVKVTLNEYLELAKEYSTPKSSIFINGILDNLVKELETNDRIKKIGRGLM